MLRIEIGQGVTLSNINQKIYEKVLGDLTLKNPDYEEAKKKGRYIPVSMSKYISYWEYNENNDSIWFPRGYLYEFKEWLKQNKIPFKISDNTLVLKRIKIPFKGKLRKYQAEAARSIKKLPIGVLEAATGSGKTVIGINMITERKQPTLIIVHSKELLYQWQESIKKFLNYDCGLVGDGQFIIRPITVGIINSVRNKIDSLINKFGHVICDEIHKIPSSTWSTTLQDFPARYYLGLSATVYRHDGLTKIIFLNIGPKLHSVDSKMLHKIGAVLKPTVKKVPTNFRFVYRDNYSAMIKGLVNDQARNNLLISTIYADYRKNKDNVLIISDRKEHCKLLQSMLFSKGLKSELLTSSVSKKARKKIVSDLLSGKCNILIATSSLIGEGFSADSLTTLHLTTPIKAKGKVTQIVGRILRPQKGKKPRIYDYRDNEVNILRYQGFARDKVYKELWEV